MTEGFIYLAFKASACDTWTDADDPRPLQRHLSTPAACLAQAALIASWWASACIDEKILAGCCAYTRQTSQGYPSLTYSLRPRLVNALLPPPHPRQVTSKPPHGSRVGYIPIQCIYVYLDLSKLVTSAIKKRLWTITGRATQTPRECR